MNTCSTSRTKPSVCFVAPNSFALFSDDSSTVRFGGSEVQQFVMSRWLAANGYDVSFITYDEGQPDDTTIDGVKIIKCYKKDSGLPGLRFVYPRWIRLWSALRQSNANVYYQRCAGAETGQVALWCRLNRRKFVFASANDRDLTRGSPYPPKLREKLLYRLGLKLADAVITQTSAQEELLFRNFQIRSVTIRNSGMAMNAKCKQEFPELRVLWAGRFVPLKRLEFLLEVAAAAPEFRFDVVGQGNSNSTYVIDLLRKASRLDNVHIIGQVPHEQMSQYYDRAAVVCSTSTEEGFPNTFIESWAAGTPVLSTLDPDQVITRTGAGWLKHTPREFVQVLRKIQDDDQAWRAAAQAAQLQYDNAHRLEPNMRTFVSLLNDIAS